MEPHLQVFVNFQQNDRTRFLLMAEFTYNNIKNASIGHTPFKLNCGYNPCISFGQDIDPCSQSKIADELLAKLQKVITIPRENLHHTQELQKQPHNKSVKPRSYSSNDKVWLNSKYIKIK